MEQKYDEIADEPCLDEDEKKTIKDEMGQLKDHWYTVTMTANAKRERCAFMHFDCENKRHSRYRLYK